MLVINWEGKQKKTERFINLGTLSLNLRILNTLYCIPYIVYVYCITYTPYDLLYKQLRNTSRLEDYKKLTSDNMIYLTVELYL